MSGLQEGRHPVTREQLWAEAAIARVRELCVTLNRDYPRNECAHLFLAALDGAG